MIIFISKPESEDTNIKEKVNELKYIISNGNVPNHYFCI